jgi:hypothetical protein
VEIATARENLALLLQRQGDLDGARAAFEENLPRWKAAGWKRHLALGLLHVADVMRVQGDPASHAAYVASLAQSRELGYLWGIAGCLEGLAMLPAAEGRQEQAVRWLAAASALRHSSHAELPRIEQADREARCARLRASLGEATFAAAWQTGHSQGWEIAMTEALAAAGPAATFRTGRHPRVI